MGFTMDVDYEHILNRLLKKGELYVSSMDGDDGSIVEDVSEALDRFCKTVYKTGVSYPATWEDESGLTVYYCPKQDVYVIAHEDITPMDWFVGYEVYRSPEKVVRRVNDIIEDWQERLLEHSRLDVPGAEDSEWVIKALEEDKITLADLKKLLSKVQ